MKILLVDDEEAICKLIKLHFQTEGYLVYTASDAEEAARMLTHSPDLFSWTSICRRLTG